MKPDYQTLPNFPALMGLFCNNEILSKHYNTYYTAPRKYKMHGHEMLIKNDFIPVYYLKSFIVGKKSTLQCGTQLALQ